MKMMKSKLRNLSIETKYLNYILSGLYSFYIGHLLYAYIFQGVKAARVFTLIGVCLLIWGFVNIKKSTKGCESGSLPIYYFFICVCLFNVIWGIPQMISTERAIELITNPQTMWMFLIGLAFLIPIKTADIKLIIKWTMLYALTSLLFSLFYFRDFYLNVVQIAQSMIGWDAYIVNRPQEPVILLVPIASFLIFFKKFCVRWRVLIVISFPLAILAALMAGRRSVSVLLFGYFLIVLYIYLIKQKSRWMNVSVTVLFFLVLFVQYGGNALLDKYFKKNFVILYERKDKDTRKEVDVDFFKDMKEPSDWVIGRGLAGTYKSINLSQIDRLHRTSIETGYLNIILHGGLLMLVPYVVLLIYAFIKGFFFSNSYFLKSCALFILYHILLLYPGGHLRLTLECFILFVFIRICLSSKWRAYSNLEINQKIANFERHERYYGAL